MLRLFPVAQAPVEHLPRVEKERRRHWDKLPDEQTTDYDSRRRQVGDVVAELRGGGTFRVRAPPPGDATVYCARTRKQEPF